MFIFFYLKSLLTITLNDDLHLPVANEFVPKNLIVRAPETSVLLFLCLQKLLDYSFAEMVVNSDKVRFWYRKDDEFLVPKAHLWFEFRS